MAEGEKIRKKGDRVFECARELVGLLLCSRNFCLRRGSRSDRYVLGRFLPVRSESCLNDTSRFPSIQCVEVMGIFQGSGPDVEQKGSGRAARAAGLFKETIIKVALIKRVAAQRGLLVRRELVASLDRCHALICYYSIGCFESEVR